MNRVNPTIQELAARLEAALPPYPAETRSVTVPLYRLLAEGQPVTPRRLGEVLAWPLTRVSAALHPFGSRLKTDRDGRIVAFGGLSLQPTAHRFTVRGQTLYTWCAWDALFLPAILQEQAEVQSACPVSQTPIRLRVTPDTVTHCDPATAVLSFVIPASAACHDDIVGNFCCYVHFFESAQAGEAWTAQHDGAFLLSVEAAFELGRQRVATRLPSG